MKINCKSLLSELEAVVNEDSQSLSSMALLSDDMLNQKASPQSWSALECLQHLNLYAEFYLPLIKEALDKGPKAGSGIFKSGVVGNYLCNMVKVKPNGKKMKTFESMNSLGRHLSREVLKTFTENQQQLLILLKKPAATDLNKGKIAVTFSSLVHLKTGDALRFMVYHNQRHILQAMRAAKI